MEVFLKFHETRSSQLVADEESTLLEKGVPTRRSAWAYAMRYRERFNNPQTPYKCPMCRKFRITSRTEGTPPQGITKFNRA
jgi:hypothetical protein